MSDRLGRAIESFRKGNHKRAILELNQILFDEPDNWAARLYLGMAYASAGEAQNSLRQFYNIYLKCPEAELRAKSRLLLPPHLLEQAKIELLQTSEADPWSL